MDPPAGLRVGEGMDADGNKVLVAFSVVPVRRECVGCSVQGKDGVALKLSIGTGTPAENVQINAGSEYPVNSRLYGVSEHRSAGTIVRFRAD